MDRILDPEHPFYVDKNLIGGDMRQQAITLYNHLAYWNEQLGHFEHARKATVAALEQAKDKAKCKRALEAKSLALKATIQDAFIRNYYDEVVLIGDEELTSSMLQQQLDEIQESELEARNNVATLQTAVDICRSALSWDRQEHQKVVG